MKKTDSSGWEKQVVAPQKVIEVIEPGMSIYLGTGVGEPRTLVKHLMAAESANLKDLELIQLVSLGSAPAVTLTYVVTVTEVAARVIANTAILGAGSAGLVARSATVIVNGDAGYLPAVMRPGP